MKLKWYGHASFRLTSENSISVITDPYTPATSGYKPIDESADIAIISSDTDSFHCRSDLIPGNPIVINALEVARQKEHQFSAKGLIFHAVEAMEALDHRAHNPDQNAMYKFEMDGLMFGHMGDVGNPLSQEQMTFFSDVDVLLTLTGGYPTILLDDLKNLIDKTKPRLVIPMHFRTLRCKLRNILWIQSFLDYFNDHIIDFAYREEVTLMADDLPSSLRILVLDYM